MMRLTDVPARRITPAATAACAYATTRRWLFTQWSAPTNIAPRTRVASAGSRTRTSAVSHASMPNSRISRPATRVSARRTSSASNSG